MKTLGMSFLVLAASLAYQPSASACSCLPFSNDFFGSVAHHNQMVESGQWVDTPRLTVVIGEVAGYKRYDSAPPDLMFRVRGIVQGEEVPKRLLVKGGDGASCEATAESFAKGKRFVLALNTNEEGRFFVPLCGTYSKELLPPQ